MFSQTKLSGFVPFATAVTGTKVIVIAVGVAVDVMDVVTVFSTPTTTTSSTFVIELCAIKSSL